MYPPKNSWRELVIVSLAFVAASVVLTLPLAQHPLRTLPSDLVDTLLTTWILAWDADHFRHALRGVWDAPFFFPYRTTLAFSENLLGLAVFVAPLHWAIGNPLLTYNTAFVGSFALAGVGMYLLVRSVTASRAAAAVAGAYYAFCPFRLAQPQLAHIQMIATGWLPIGLWALHQYWFTFARRWLVLFVAAYCLQALSNSYVAYFMAVPVVAVVVAQANLARGRLLRTVVELAAAGAVIAALLAPVAAQYYRVRSTYQQVRSTGEIEQGGADVRAYFVPLSGIWRWFLPLPTPIFGESEKELFPGVVGPLLALLGLAAARVRAAPLRQWARLYGWIAFLGFVLSLGPLVRVWGVVITAHGPYDWLQHLLPGMTGMRVPSRFTIIFITGLSVLAGCGAVIALAWTAPRRRPLVLVAMLLGIVADGWAVPIPIVHYAAGGRPEDRAVAEWLHDAPPGAALHLPVNTAQFQQLHYQYATLMHGHPIVNGFSGWDTPLVNLLRQPWAPLYDYERYAAVVRMFRSIGVRDIIVHPDDYNVTQLANGELTRTLEGLRASGQIARETRRLGVYLFVLEPWPDERTPPGPLAEMAPREFTASVSPEPNRLGFLVDGDPDTRWIGRQDGSSSIALTFNQPRDVARIELLLATRSLTDYPRELRVDAVDMQNRVRTLYDASPYPEFIAGFLRNPNYPPLLIELPANESLSVIIREVATHRSWWSVHELRLWRRS